MSKLWHIKVRREIMDDDFDTHMRSEEQPTDEQILLHLEKEEYWTPGHEEYEFNVNEVKI